MRLLDCTNASLVYLDLTARTKEETITLMVERLGRSGEIEDSTAFLREVSQREASGTTAIGRGVAIPHARIDGLEKIVMAIGRLAKGIDFGAEDGEPVRLLFLLAAPEEHAAEYLKVLARLSKLLKENGLRKKLLKAKEAEAVLNAIEEAEARLV